VAVLDRIEVEIVQVDRVIAFVPDRMFPVPTLPDSPLAPRSPHRHSRTVRGIDFENATLIAFQREA
jgi:hypothetical protein